MSTRQPKPWTPERHAAAKAREAAATKGPWAYTTLLHDDRPGTNEVADLANDCYVVTDAPLSHYRHDGEFIAAAREDVPDMLAKIEEQAAEIERLEASELDLVRKAGEIATRDSITIKSLVAEVDFYKRLGALLPAIGGVGDDGRYRNDIIDALRNRLKPEWGGPPNEHEPDSVSPPGETIQEALDAVGMSRGLLAQRMGLPPEMVDLLIEGKVALTEEIAEGLRSATGIPMWFWFNRERIYRDSLARKGEKR